MRFQLECLFDPQRGRLLTVTVDRPLIIRTNKGEQDAGEVVVEVEDDTCVLTNRSRMSCTVNGRPRQRWVLASQDLIVIGKRSFRLLVEDDMDATSTQEVGLAQLPTSCSVCDGDFAGGWSDGDHRICRTCLAKGVKPDHLPRPGSPLDDIRDHLHVEGGPQTANDTTVNLSAPESPAKDAAPANSTDSDRQRRQRRLSASQLAHVDPAPPKSGLLSKVSSVFSGREDRRRLEVLEQERTAILLDGGRLCLTGLSLPDHLLGPLMKGVSVTVRPQDVSVALVDQWRALRERLMCLDAEITALRTALGLGPDPSLRLVTAPLRTDQLRHQDRAFQAMDGLPTQDLAGLGPEPPPALPAPSPANAVRKPVRRRR